MPKLTVSQKLRLLAKQEAAQDRKRKAKARATERRRRHVRDRYEALGLPIPEELADL
jgi:hypothetical protein